MGDNIVNRAEYVKNIALSLNKDDKKKKKLSEKLGDNSLTQNAIGKMDADLNWLCMEIAKNEERIGYAMGFLNLGDLRETYEPSGWHEYKGIKEEMEKLKFE